MFVEVHTPERLTGQELDAYLERGWFRMGQTIFTTNFAHVKDQMLSTIWLRVKLFEYEQEPAHAKLLKRNAQFATTIRLAQITEEKETLYTQYRESLSFAVSESLQHLLLGKGEESIYTTYEVTVTDQGKLIACGFFDLGGNSSEGIVSFYDPAYKKYSLGKYLIFCKMQFCKELGLEYFYPGYFVPGNPYFDYKLSIGRSAMQFLHLGSNSWRNISTFTVEDDIPVGAMEIKLNELKLLLEKAVIENRVMKYEFFDAGLIPEMRNTGLLDFPLFLHLGNAVEEPVNALVVFDVRDNQYHLLVCAPVWKPDRTNPDATFYSAFFLKPVQEIYQSPDVRAIAELLIRINERAPLQNL